MSAFVSQETKRFYRRPQLLLPVKESIEEVNCMFGLLEYDVPSQHFPLKHRGSC
jgi:hypothetical protein